MLFDGKQIALFQAHTFIDEHQRWRCLMLLFQPADYNQCALLQERPPDERLAS
jgi:hypothetical protein